MSTASPIPEVNVADGVVALGPAATATKNALQRVFGLWASQCGASEWDFSPLIAADQLEKFDYFENFPHLGVQALPPSPHPDRFISSAACYSVYAGLADSELQGNMKLTLTQRCCRTEAYYEGLRRLHAFTMREIVALGDPEFTRQHLVDFSATVSSFAYNLGITTTLDNAVDPFFDPNGSRAMSQRLFPVKQELTTDDGVAIASFNSHRNFFGERAAITVAGDPITTSCVAFGLERWLHALDRVFDADWVRATAAVDRLYEHAASTSEANGAQR